MIKSLNSQKSSAAHSIHLKNYSFTTEGNANAHWAKRL